MDRRELLRRRILDMYGLDEDTDNAIIFEKLGDALRFSFTSELGELATNEGKGEAPHFYAALSYLYLNNFISSECAERARMVMFIESRGEESIKSVIEQVSKIIFNGLKSHIKFKDLNEIVDELNQYRIDNWYFDVGKKLIESYVKNSFLYNNMLYFIGENKEENDYALNRISIDQIRSDTDFLDDDVEMLADGFRHILAFDEKDNKIYLQMYDQKKYFACYDLICNEVVFHKHKFMALADGLVWVITRDNWVAYLLGDKLHPVRKYVDGEIYESKKDCFLVTPDKYKNLFFYPYYVFFDGRTKLADRKDYETVLWGKFLKGKVDGSNSIDVILSDDKLCKRTMPTVFSINKITEGLNSILSSDKRCSNRGYILLESLFDVLKKYVDPDLDFAELWFTLAEANAYFENSEFPSEKLYWRLKEIEVENKVGDTTLQSLLENCDYDNLFVELVKEIKYGNKIDLDNCTVTSKEEELEILNKNNYILDDFKIGTFNYINGELVTNIMPLEDGILIGDQIIPKGDFSLVGGMVAYDEFRKRNIVISDKQLNIKSRLELKKEFGFDSRVIYIRGIVSH